jgi:putative transposase
VIKRNRTPSEYIGFGLYLYFSGLSLRRVSQMLSCFIRRNHVSIWNWIQKYKPQKISAKTKKVSMYIVDETMLKVGSEYIWLWIAIERENKQILALYVSKERNMFVVAEHTFFQVLYIIMERILFQPMVELGTQWLASF